MKRYYPVISLALLIAALIVGFAWRMGESSDCKAEGGHYVSTFTGWECIK